MYSVNGKLIIKYVEEDRSFHLNYSTEPIPFDLIKNNNHIADIKKSTKSEYSFMYRFNNNHIAFINKEIKKKLRFKIEFPDHIITVDRGNIMITIHTIVPIKSLKKENSYLSYSCNSSTYKLSVAFGQGLYNELIGISQQNLTASQMISKENAISNRTERFIPNNDNKAQKKTHNETNKDKHTQNRIPNTSIYDSKYTYRNCVNCMYLNKQNLCSSHNVTVRLDQVCNRFQRFKFYQGGAVSPR